MTHRAITDGTGIRRYVVRSATRAQIKAARMLLAREKAGLANPSDKVRAVAQVESDGPVGITESRRTR